MLFATASLCEEDVKNMLQWPECARMMPEKYGDGM